MNYSITVDMLILISTCLSLGLLIKRFPFLVPILNAQKPKLITVFAIGLLVALLDLFNVIGGIELRMGILLSCLLLNYALLSSDCKIR